MGLLQKWDTKRLLEGQNITLVNKGIFGADFSTVSDVSNALLLSISRNVSGPINIGCGTQTTVRRIVELLLENSNRDWSAVDYREVEKLDEGFPALDISKAISMGYQPTSIENGIRSFVKWVKQ